jgi:dienelactone hydrolase
VRERPSFVKCLVAFYAILDLRHLIPGSADAAQTERMRRFSPALHLTAASMPPPLLIARAGLDTPAVNTGIDVFVRDALHANVYLDVLTHPHGQHGFDVLDDDARSRDIIARAMAFATERLRGPEMG